MMVTYIVLIVFIHSKQKLFENKDFFGVVVPSIDARILEFNQYQKSDEALMLISHFKMDE